MKTYLDIIEESSSEDIQLTKHFKLSEFACKDGSPMPSYVVENIKKLASILEVIREAYSRLRGQDTSFIITSGYRSKKYNDWLRVVKKKKTAVNSQHIQGKAADIIPEDGKTKDLYNLILQLIKDKKIPNGYVHYYPPKSNKNEPTGNFIHYDYVPRNGLKTPEPIDDEEDFENSMFIPVATKLDPDEPEEQEVSSPQVKTQDKQIQQEKTIFNPKDLKDLNFQVDMKKFKG